MLCKIYYNSYIVSIEYLMPQQIRLYNQLQDVVIIPVKEN